VRCAWNGESGLYAKKDTYQMGGAGQRYCYQHILRGAYSFGSIRISA
jgi:hypothetical protein